MTFSGLQPIHEGEPELIPLAGIRTHESLQPRIEHILPVNEIDSARRSSASLKDSFTLRLKEFPALDFDPICIAEIKGDPHIPDGLYVYDGHHRLDAYRYAGRERIPALVTPMDYRSAVLASKAANCDRRAMRMHTEQYLDALWQTLVMLTDGGKKPLPKGMSTRKLATFFDVGKSTAHRMMNLLKQVNPDDYNAMRVHPATGWPYWKYVRQDRNNWKNLFAVVPEDARALMEARLCVSKVLANLSKISPAARARFKEAIEAEAEFDKYRQEIALDALLDLLET